MTDSDEWWMRVYATKGKSEPVWKDSVNPSDFKFAKNCQIPTTFKFGFKLWHIPNLNWLLVIWTEWNVIGRSYRGLELLRWNEVDEIITSHNAQCQNGVGLGPGKVKTVSSWFTSHTSSVNNSVYYAFAYITHMIIMHVDKFHIYYYTITPVQQSFFRDNLGKLASEGQNHSGF